MSQSYSICHKSKNIVNYKCEKVVWAYFKVKFAKRGDITSEFINLYNMSIEYETKIIDEINID